MPKSHRSRERNRELDEDEYVSQLYQVVEPVPARSEAESSSQDETVVSRDDPQLEAGNGIITPPRPHSPYSIDLEGEQPPCAQCSRNVPCLFFYAQVIFSLVILVTGVVGLAGIIDDTDSCFNKQFYSNLLTVVMTFWISRAVHKHV